MRVKLEMHEVVIPFEEFEDIGPLKTLKEANSLHSTLCFPLPLPCYPHAKVPGRLAAKIFFVATLGARCGSGNLRSLVRSCLI